MTTPDEMVRSIGYAGAFLRSLIDPAQTPRVPRAIRNEACARLRHFPHDSQYPELAREILKKGKRQC